MIIVNTEFVPGYQISQVCGFVDGNTVRAKNAGRDFTASIKNFFGGELHEYSELMAESRWEATNRMIERATQLGADAIINVRYATTSIAAGAAELYVYGTAVNLQKIEQETKADSIPSTEYPSSEKEKSIE